MARLPDAVVEHLDKHIRRERRRAAWRGIISVLTRNRDRVRAAMTRRPR